MIKLQPKPVKEYAYIGLEINLKDKELLKRYGGSVAKGMRLILDAVREELETLVQKNEKEKIEKKNKQEVS